MVLCVWHSTQTLTLQQIDGSRILVDFQLGPQSEENLFPTHVEITIMYAEEFQFTKPPQTLMNMLEQYLLRRETNSTLAPLVDQNGETTKQLGEPTDGGFTAWVNGSCSKSCGEGGISINHRYCTAPRPRFGGNLAVD